MESQITATLMNKNTPIVEFNGIIQTGVTGFYNIIFKEITVLNYKLSPIIINETLAKEKNLENINYWFNKRLFSAKRKLPHTDKVNYEEIYPHFFSLSDQYWIRYEENETWDELSFFKNKANPVLGEYLFSQNRYIRDITIPHDSPEITTNGIQNKRWVLKAESPVLGNIYALRKRASKELGTEVYSDVIASNILKKLKIINFVESNLVIDNGQVASECFNFVTSGTELVSATSILMVTPKKDNEDIYETLIRAGEIYHINGIKDYLNSMIYVDTTLHNEDRNTGNIGFLRDETGKFIGCAPLYDFGFSFLKTAAENKTLGIFENRRRKLIKDGTIPKPNAEILMEEVANLNGPEVNHSNKIIEERARESSNRYIF